MTYHYGEFIYDSSVIIAQVFEESRFKSRIQHLEKNVDRLSVVHLATPTTIRETREKVKYIGEYFTETVRDLHRSIMYKKDPSNTNPDATMGQDDIPFLKTYFANTVRGLKSSQPDQREKLKEKLDYTETWIKTNFRDYLGLTSKRTVPVRDFMATCASWATDLHSSLNIELQRRISKSTGLSADEAGENYIKSHLPFLKNEGDVSILSELVKYQKIQKKFVFVVLDYRDLVSHALEIYDSIGIRIADPLYALDILSDPNIIKPVQIFPSVSESLPLAPKNSLSSII